MTRMVRDFIEIADNGSLTGMIEQLSTIRDMLPTEAEAAIRMRGDDVFGRHICVAFLRPLTPEEAALEARYAQPELVYAAA